MKKLILTCIAIAPLLCNAQIYFGSTEKQIRDSNPGKEFKENYTPSGQKVLSVKLENGTYIYQFNTQTELSTSCIQVVDNIVLLNEQVEIYNKNYVTISDSKWKAYLEGGKILNINLSWDDKSKVYVFHYSY